MKHLNQDERLDVMEFLDRGSLCAMSIASSKLNRIVESLPPNLCLLHLADASITDVPIRRSGLRARLARLRRALLPQRYGKLCLSVRPRNGVALKDTKTRSNRPEELLERLQHVLRVSAAEFVHIDGGVFKGLAVCALHGGLQLPEVKAGHVGMLCVYNAVFTDAHTATFEVSRQNSVKI